MLPSITASAMSWGVETGVGADGWDTILCWALTPENESILFRIENYPSSFYFEFEEQDQVDFEYALFFYKQLRLALGKNARYCLSISPEDLCIKSKLYYGRKAMMLKLKFSNRDTARHAKNILDKGIRSDESYYSDRIHGTCHETEQQVDIFRKLISEVDIKYCGWFKCDAKEVPNGIHKISTCEHEYIVRYQTITRVELDIVPRPLWLDFDLEVYSHNHDQFPRHWNSKDVIHTCSIVLRRDGDPPEKWVEYVICSYPHIIEHDDIANVIIIQVRDENELILEYARLMRELNPDLVSGYNINQFDNKYMDARIQLPSCMGEWPILGRLKDRAGVAYNISWSSNAYKEKDIYIPRNFGRQYLDMMEQMMRTMQLGSYSLENVAREVFPDDKTKRKQDVSPKKQFEIYKAVQDVIANGQLDRFYEDEDREQGSGDDAVYRILADAGTLIRYCIFDSRIVGHIANKITFWVGVREMCNANGVQPEGLLTRGAQYKVCSLLYAGCYKDGIVVTKRLNAPQFYYRGGLVQDPVLGHSEQVMLMDFQSLYPNVMIAHNICYTTLVPEEDWNLYTPDQYEAALVEICDIDPETENAVHIDDARLLEDKAENNTEDGEKEDTPPSAKKKGKKKTEIVYYKKEMRYLKPHVRQGVLPKILRGLLDERKRVRDIKTDDPVRKVVIGMQQLALKICANSVYGFTGVRSGGGKGAKAQCLELTATTCHYGRAHITQTIEWMIAKYNAKLIYGDTDSCMMQIAGGLVGDIYAHAKRIAAEASEAQYPLVLEMEGVFDMFCQAQKMYAKATYKNRANNKSEGDLITDSKGNLKLEVKGLAPARRDSCSWVRETIYTIIMMIMEKKGYYACVHYLIERVRDMYNESFPMSDFIISKSLSSGYKNDNTPMKVFAEEMAQLGLTLEAGQRHEYVVIANSNIKTVAKRMLLVSQFDGKVHKLDFDYYFKNLLMKKIDTTIAAQFGRVEELKEIYLQVQRNKIITGEKPAKLIATFMARKMNLMAIDRAARKIDKEIAEKKRNRELAELGIQVRVRDKNTTVRRRAPPEKRPEAM